MRIEQQQADIFTIYEARNLDPVTVIMQDIAPSKHRLIVECYGEAWTGFWGNTGYSSLREFLIYGDADYFANRMRTARMIKRDVAYLRRIMVEVINVLCEQGAVK